METYGTSILSFIWSVRLIDCTRFIAIESTVWKSIGDAVCVCITTNLQTSFYLNVFRKRKHLECIGYVLSLTLREWNIELDPESILHRTANYVHLATCERTKKFFISSVCPCRANRSVVLYLRVYWASRCLFSVSSEPCCHCECTALSWPKHWDLVLLAGRRGLTTSGLKRPMKDCDKWTCLWDDTKVLRRIPRKPLRLEWVRVFCAVKDRPESTRVISRSHSYPLWTTSSSGKFALKINVTWNDKKVAGTEESGEISEMFILPC